jgi:hypothetical protein
MSRRQLHRAHYAVDAAREQPGANGAQERCRGVIGFVLQKIANRALGFLRLMGLLGFPQSAILPNPEAYSMIGRKSRVPSMGRAM